MHSMKKNFVFLRKKINTINENIMLKQKSETSITKVLESSGIFNQKTLFVSKFRKNIRIYRKKKLLLRRKKLK